jgi:hypothetical protein
VEVQMDAMSQCWFTREHRPTRERRRTADGTYTGTCRYCQRALVSHDRETWTVAGEFDVSSLTAGRVLTVIDTYEDMIIRRVLVPDADSEADVDVMKHDLRTRYGLDDPGSPLILRDSAPPARRVVRRTTTV